MDTNSNPITVPSTEPAARAGRSSRRHVLFSCGLALTLAITGAACSKPRDVAGATSAELRCEQLPSGDAGEAVLILGDGLSPSLTQAITALGERSEQVFGADSADADGSSEDASGIVVLATFDDAGATTVHGEFDLRGVADESRRRRADAERQQRCLELASEGMSAAPVRPAPSGDTVAAAEQVPELARTTSLLRALGPAAAQARSAAGSQPATIVVTGVSRSLIEGYPLSSIDLSTDGRAALFARMAESELPLPDLAEHDVNVVFLNPTEGVSSAIVAGGIEAFVTDLCEQLGASSCGIRPVLG